MKREDIEFLVAGILIGSLIVVTPVHAQAVETPAGIQLLGVGSDDTTNQDAPALATGDGRPWWEAAGSFVLNLGAGVGLGAWHMIKGIGQLGYGLVTRPVGTISGLGQGLWHAVTHPEMAVDWARDYGARLKDAAANDPDKLARMIGEAGFNVGSLAIGGAGAIRGVRALRAARQAARIERVARAEQAAAAARAASRAKYLARRGRTAPKPKVVPPEGPVELLKVPGLRAPVQVVRQPGSRFYRGLSRPRRQDFARTDRLTIKDPHATAPAGEDLGWALVDHANGGTNRAISLTSDPRVAHLNARNGGQFVEVTLPEGTTAYSTANFSNFDGAGSVAKKLGESEWLVFDEIPGAHVRILSADEVRTLVGQVAD